MTATTVDELLAPEADFISQEEPASHAKRRMDTNETRSLLVMENERVVGIIKRNDLINASTEELENPVSTLMALDVPTIRQGQSIQEAYEAVGHDINIEQVPVLDESGNLVGVVVRGQLSSAAGPGGTEPGSAPVEGERAPIREGMTAKDADGSKLGTVTGEFDFKLDGQVETFIVEHGLIFKKQKKLPGDLITSFDGDDMHLAITSQEFSMMKDIGEEG